MSVKDCPVDWGKLLIGLECCREKDPEKCPDCPYYPIRNYCGGALAGDALAYIGWLEEMVEGLLSEPVQAAIKGIVRVFDEMLLKGGKASEAACGMPRNGHSDGLDPGPILVDELEGGAEHD